MGRGFSQMNADFKPVLPSQAAPIRENPPSLSCLLHRLTASPSYRLNLPQLASPTLRA